LLERVIRKIVVASAAHAVLFGRPLLTEAELLQQLAVAVLAAFGRHTAAVASVSDVDYGDSLAFQLGYRLALNWQVCYYSVLPAVAEVGDAAAQAQKHFVGLQALQIAALFVLVYYTAFAFGYERVLLVDSAAYLHELGRQRGPAPLVEDYARPL